MFQNLVECANTQKNGSKKWAYFAATSLVWSLAVTIAIIVGIFMYDAELNQQYQLLTLVALPTPPAPPAPAPVKTLNNIKQANNRAEFTDHTAMVKPPEISENPPAKVEIKPVSYTPNLPSGTGGPGGSGSSLFDGPIGGNEDSEFIHSVGDEVVKNIAPPPLVTKVEKPTITKFSEGVIRGNSRLQVKPDYPALARQSHIAGDVQIELTINENGDVVGARVLSGPPLLQSAAMAAARQWKFNPTLLNNVAVKVQGILTFRFTL